MNTGNDDRLLVITLSNIGDLVLTTPVFEALAAHFPRARIDVIGDARSAELLAAAPYIGDIHLYDKRASLAKRVAFLLARRARRYRLVVDLRTAFFASLMRAQRRLRKREGRLAGRHAVLEHFATLAPVLGAAPPPPCRVHLAPASVARAAAWLADLPGSRWLALAPGANFPGKKWPREAYRQLLELCAARFDAALLLGSAQDLDDVRALADASLPTLVTAGISSLPDAAALLARATAFVGNDSGLGHVAAAVGTPSLTVFGPGDPARYRPWGPRARIVRAPGEDLHELSPAVVRDALQNLLDQATETH